MPQGGWYTWLIVGIGAVLWGFAIWWQVRTSRKRLADDQEKMARRELSSIGSSEALMLEAIERHPRSCSPKCAYAHLAVRRRDWEEALQRYQFAIERHPRDARGYAGAAAALRGMNRLDDSDAMLRRGEKRCRQRGPLHSEYAWNATARKDWREAARRWAMHRRFRPNQKYGYEQGELALRRAGLAQEADALAAEKAERFPTFDRTDREEPVGT